MVVYNSIEITTIWHLDFNWIEHTMPSKMIERNLSAFSTARLNNQVDISFVS